ncbi:MAG: formyltransferase family protein [Candidatus Thermoplasmatota archaeon]
MVYKLGWFSTGRDEAARELLTTIKNGIDKGEIDAKLEFVFSNREFGESKESDKFFQLVRSYDIDLICFSSAKFKRELWKRKRERWRIEYDREIMKRLANYKVDLNILAGYMLIVGKELCRKYNLINLHPAAPKGPIGTWQEVIWKLIQQRAKETGIIIHLVTEILDRGPVMTYCTFPIVGKEFDELWKEIKGRDLSAIIKEEGENNKLFKKIREEGVKRELPMIFHTIKELASGRIVLKGKNVYVNGKLCPQGYCMNEILKKVISE